MVVEYEDKAKSSETPSENFSHVISTIPLRDLELARPSTSEGELHHLSPNVLPVTVMVVNLFYANPHLLPTRGFGYLIPKSIPLPQNPHRALGVVFDSDACVGQDTATGTKLTVMLGGHWWSDFQPGDYPSEDDGVRMAQDVLRQHLGISDEPVLCKATLQRNCIPQYGVGHEEQMGRLTNELLAFGGRLRLAGISYTGVGLNDCVRAAREVVDGLVEGTAITGLDGFRGGETQWAWMRMQKAC